MLKLTGACWVAWRVRVRGQADGRPSTMCAAKSLYPTGAGLTFCNEPFLVQRPIRTVREFEVRAAFVKVDFLDAEHVDCRECREELMQTGTVVAVPA